LSEPNLLSVSVECYAGYRGEQTPRTLILGDHRIVIAEVVDAWLAPDYRYFKLRGADGSTYLVRHDEQSDIWELTMFRAEEIRR
jgi:flavin reductase (DIM6/NTAB) family NADH-FMN oxidoreductase RutF